MATSAAVTITRLEKCLDGWWEIAWKCGDLDRFKSIVQAVKAIPPQRRSYDAVRKVWRVPSAGYLLALDLHIPGLAQRVEQLLGAEREPRPAMSVLPDAVARAYTTLYLLPTAPRALVEASRRVLAREFHPDHGGGHTEMVAVNNAADAVLAWIDRHRAPKPSPSGPTRRQRAGTGRQAAA